MLRKHVATISVPSANKDEKVRKLIQELEQVAKKFATDPSRVCVTVNAMYMGRVVVSVRGIPSISETIVCELTNAWRLSQIDNGRCNMQIDYENECGSPVIKMTGQYMFDIIKDKLGLVSKSTLALDTKDKLESPKPSNTRVTSIFLFLIQLLLCAFLTKILAYFLPNVQDMQLIAQQWYNYTTYTVDQFYSNNTTS